MRKLFALVAMSLIVLTGCNTVRGTVHGVGQDASQAGTWIQEKVPGNQ